MGLTCMDFTSSASLWSADSLREADWQVQMPREMILGAT